MCLLRTTTASTPSYNWDGDRIVQNTVVPSARPIVGLKEDKEFDIDIREYLVTEKNAVVKVALMGEIRKFVSTLPVGSWDLFQSREEGSFDFRAYALNEYVSAKFKYTQKGIGEPWLFPDETLMLKFGDCEDIAFLQASLMIASGISNYNVRVVLGKVVVKFADETSQTYDHCWVVYKNERGVWHIIEPLHRMRGHTPRAEFARKSAKRNDVTDMQYLPLFLFNDQHLWVDRHSEFSILKKYLGKRSKGRLHPTFAGEAHQTILHRAFEGLPDSYAWFKNFMFNQFLFGVKIPIVGTVIPVIDRKDFDWGDLRVFPYPQLAYEPLQHFDNGYIQKSWDRVGQNLGAFAANNHQADAFARAAHAIADFYAHSSYSCFAEHVTVGSDKYLRTYRTGVTMANPRYDATSPMNLTSTAFSTNSRFFTGSKANIPTIWGGTLVSGRYSQSRDSHGTVEALSAPLIKQSGESATSFANRGSLPHHNEIAVDGDNQASNTLYTAAGDYAKEFALRQNTAIAHVQQEFYNHISGSKTELNNWWSSVPKI